MWKIQILFAGQWLTLPLAGFDSRDAAEWAVGKWKQANDCTGDPFRAVPAAEVERDAKPKYNPDDHI